MSLLLLIVLLNQMSPLLPCGSTSAVAERPSLHQLSTKEQRADFRSEESEGSTQTQCQPSAVLGI